MIKFKTMLHFMILPVTLIGIMTLSSSCKNDDDVVDPITEKINELSANWQLGNVTNDNTNVSDQYSGFTLTIDNFNFKTQNGGNPWPNFGSYDFKDNDLSVIVRNDGIEMTIDELTTTFLVLSFRFNALPGGRVTGLTGNFTFSLVRL